MQTRLVLYHLLQYAERTKKRMYLYVRPTGLRLPNSQGIVIDDGHYVVTGYRFDDDERQPAQLPIEGWCNAFWRIMESAGWRLAGKRPVARGELLWTLALMEQGAQAEGVPCLNELLTYVEKIRPMAGERAQRALELATTGKVHKLEPCEDGKDQWEVQGHSDKPYSVSITGGSCSCPDAANGAPRWMDAPLCKHRLAVMYITRWEQDQHKRYQPQPLPLAPDEPPSAPQGTLAPPYVTVVQPSSSKEGWRWVHVRGEGQLSYYSRQEYPSQEAVLPVAQLVAQSKAVPFFYDSQGQGHQNGVYHEGRQMR